MPDLTHAVVCGIDVGYLWRVTHGALDMLKAPTASVLLCVSALAAGCIFRAGGDLPDVGPELDTGSMQDSQASDSGPEDLGGDTADQARPDLTTDPDAEPDLRGDAADLPGTPPVTFFGYTESYHPQQAEENTMINGWPGQGRVAEHHFVELEGILFDDDPSTGRAMLAPDWETRWEDMANMARTDVSLGLVTGFNLGGALLYDGLSIADLDLVADTIRASFPEQDIFLAEEVDVVSVGRNRFGEDVPFEIPDSVNLFGLYSWRGFDTDANTFQPMWRESIASRYESYVFTRLKPHQRVMLMVQGSAYPEDLCPATCWDPVLAEDARYFFEMAKSDDRVVGLIAFSWRAGQAGLAIGDLPQTHAEYVAIGQEVDELNAP